MLINSKNLPDMHRCNIEIPRCCALALSPPPATFPGLISSSRILLSTPKPSPSAPLFNTSQNGTSRPMFILSLRSIIQTDTCFVGRQAPHPTRARAPPGQVHRHWAPRHDELGVEDQHPPRHQGQRRRPHALALLHGPRPERAHGKGEGAAHPANGPARWPSAAEGGRDGSARRRQWRIMKSLTGLSQP